MVLPAMVCDSKSGRGGEPPAGAGSGCAVVRSTRWWAQAAGCTTACQQQYVAQISHCISRQLLLVRLSVNRSTGTCCCCLITRCMFPSR